MVDSLQIRTINDQLKDLIRWKAVDLNRLAMEYCIKTCKETNNQSYMVRAFWFGSKCKSRLLNEEMVNRNALRETNVPRDSIRKLENLNEKIASLRNLRSRVGFIHTEATTRRLDSIERELHQQYLEKEDILDNLEAGYQDFKQLRYRFINPEVPIIQNHLDTGQVILEYLFGSGIKGFQPELLYCFLLSADTLMLMEIPVDMMFFNALRDVVRYISQNPFIRMDTTVKKILDANAMEFAGYLKYLSGAEFLYNCLLKPVEDIVQGKSLLVSADGSLLDLPFETLLFAPPSTTADYDFVNLSFLLKRHPVSYIPAAGLTFFKPPEKRKLRSILAMAPDYRYFNERKIKAVLLTKEEHQMNRNYETSTATYLTLHELLGAREECLYLGENYKAAVYLNTQANKKNFLEQAPRFDILQLSLHGFMNEANPAVSKLAFAPVTITDTTFFLHSYEIRQLDLKAGLIVLGACRTDAGKHDKSEELLSTARCFFLSGDPLIIAPCWDVDDFSSKEILNDFFSCFFAGNAPDKALRVAKINFLSKADRIQNHPYFWAAYRCLGNPEGITAANSKSSRLHWIPWVILVSFLVVLIGFLIPERINS